MKMIVSNKTTLILMIFAGLLMSSMLTMSAQVRTISANQKYIGNVNASPDVRETYANQEPTMRAFPNPSFQNDVLTIQVFQMEFQAVNVSLIESITGEPVYENVYDNVAEMLQIRIDLTDIQPGQYVLRVTGDKETLNEMVVVR